MKTKRFLAVLLSLAMFIGMLPMSAFASYELGTSLDVSAEEKCTAFLPVIICIMNT